MMVKDTMNRETLLRNLMAALAVSFVALSLGAAFGVLSGRGAFAGMISAAIIPIVTSAFGGTRVQTSGPTAPMTTITAVVVAFAYDSFAKSFPGYPPEQFVSLVILATALLLIVAGVFRLGQFIEVVPRVVISGFQNGIAILIWVDVCKRLFGLAGKQAYRGGAMANGVVLLLTVLIVFFTPHLTRRLVPKLAGVLSGTVIAIVIVSGAAFFFIGGIERVELPTLAEIGNPATLFLSYLPQRLPPTAALLLALKYGFILAMLAYLDSLLTALVVDKLTGEKTQQNRELIAQGLSAAAVVPFGGIPGAQATIRSVLIVNEGATMRLAGVMVGVFALAEMLVFRNLIVQIPQAVLGGVLIKVGYDVFDWRPLLLYLRQLRGGSATGVGPIGHGAVVFIVGTTLVTVLKDLNTAVIVFTALFYLVNLGKNRLNDLMADEAEGLED